MNTRASSSDGFTLIETLVVLMIVAMLSVGAGTMLTQTIQAGKQVEARSDALADMQIANALLRDDLASLTQRASTSPDPFERPSVFKTNTVDSDEAFLVFTRHGWSKPPSGEARSDLQRVAYSFEDGELIRKAWLRPDPDRETEIIERVLLSGVQDLRISYSHSGVWLPEWRQQVTDDDRVRLPEAIEIICEFSEGDEFRQVFVTGARS